jgi:hypothetical protein
MRWRTARESDDPGVNGIVGVASALPE